MGRPKTLTKEEVLHAIELSFIEHGVAPTIEELKRKLRVGSNRTVLRYLAWLEDEGDIERWAGARGIRLRRSSEPDVETRPIPVVGTAPAGSLMTAEENWEGIVRVPMAFLSPPQARFFLLRVRGDSMNRAAVSGERIEDGDLVLVRQQGSVQAGDIVIALIDGEATIKRFSREKGYFVLRPESNNTNHTPIIVADTFRSQGVVRHVFKHGASLIE